MPDPDTLFHWVLFSPSAVLLWLWLTPIVRRLPRRGRVITEYSGLRRIRNERTTKGGSHAR